MGPYKVEAEVFTETGDWLFKATILLPARPMVGDVILANTWNAFEITRVRMREVAESDPIFKPVFVVEGKRL